MKNSKADRNPEHGGAGIKFLLVFLTLLLLANAGYQYVPVAYEGANFKQEMDTAVVKGLATSGQLKPLDVVKASVMRAASDNNIPADAVVEIKPVAGAVQAHVVYSKKVSMLPFGLYNYSYDFNHLARPTGYLLKQ